MLAADPPEIRAKPSFGLGNLVNANNVNALVDAIITQFLSREEIQKLVNPLRIDKEIPIDDKGNHVSDVSNETSKIQMATLALSREARQQRGIIDCVR